jgi:hypothetical protein
MFHPEKAKRVALLAKEREGVVTWHRRNKKRSGRPRKYRWPITTLTDCDLATLSYLISVAPGQRYARDIAEVTGFPVSQTETALLRLNMLHCVAAQSRCKGYRPFTWQACPGRRGLGASPEVKAALAAWMESRKAANEDE